MSWQVTINVIASQGHTLKDRGEVHFFLGSRQVIVPLSSIQSTRATSVTSATSATSGTSAPTKRDQVIYCEGDGVAPPISTVQAHLVDPGAGVAHGTLSIPLQRFATDGHQVEQWYQLAPTPDAGRCRPTLRLSLCIAKGHPIKGEKLYSVELDTTRKTKLGATIRVDSSGVVRIASINPFLEERMPVDGKQRKNQRAAVQRPSPLFEHGGVGVADELLSVNEFSVEHMTLEQVVRLLRIESLVQNSVILRLQNATKEQKLAFQAELALIQNKSRSNSLSFASAFAPSASSSTSPNNATDPEQLPSTTHHTVATGNTDNTDNTDTPPSLPPRIQPKHPVHSIPKKVWNDIPTASKDHLRAGVVRYVCVCGPGELSSMNASMLEEINIALKRKRQTQSRKRQRQDTNCMQTTSSTTGQDISIIQRYTSEVHLLDRYPRSDYPDDPLVDKIEWFCYPTGRTTCIRQVVSSQTSDPFHAGTDAEAAAIAANVPKPRSWHFTLTKTENNSNKRERWEQSEQTKRGGRGNGASYNGQHPLGRHRRGGSSGNQGNRRRRRSRGNSEEDLDEMDEGSDYGATGKQYGTCVVFYELTTWLILTEQHDDRVLVAGSASSEGSQKWTTRVMCWTPKCLAAISPLPLPSITHGLLLKLLSWSTTATTTSEGTGETTHDEELLNARRSLIESTIVRATFEIPQPIPNVLGLDINGDLNRPLCRRVGGGGGNTLTSRYTRIEVQRLTMVGCELPTLPFSTLPMFGMFNVDTLVNLWGHAMLGDRILLVGSQLNALTIVAETVVGLLYPLKWTGAYVPVTPYPFLTLVHAPMSWILGVEISTSSGNNNNAKVRRNGGANEATDEENDAMHVKRSGGANDARIPFGTGVGWSGEKNSGVFTFEECMSEIDLHEGEIIVDVDRGCLFYADVDGTLIPTDDEDKSKHVALPLLDRIVLTNQLTEILANYQSTRYQHEAHEEQQRERQQEQQQQQQHEEEIKHSNNKTSSLALEKFDRRVRTSFAECFGSMIAGYRDYLFYLDDEMPVFNGVEFMRDRIVHNRRRLAARETTRKQRQQQQQRQHKMEMCNVDPDDETDFECSKRFLSTLFQSQSFLLFLDEADLTVNKVFHALCYDIAQGSIGETSQVEILLDHASIERKRLEKIICVGGQQLSSRGISISSVTNDASSTTTGSLSPSRDHTIGPFESQEHRQLVEHFVELAGDAGRRCTLEGRRSFSFPSLTHDSFRKPRMIRATHAARVLFRNNNGNSETTTSAAKTAPSTENKRAIFQRRWLRKVRRNLTITSPDSSTAEATKSSLKTSRRTASIAIPKGDYDFYKSGTTGGSLPNKDTEIEDSTDGGLCGWRNDGSVVSGTKGFGSQRSRSAGGSDLMKTTLYRAIKRILFGNPNLCDESDLVYLVQHGMQREYTRSLYTLLLQQPPSRTVFIQPRGSSQSKHTARRRTTSTTSAPPNQAHVVASNKPPTSAHTASSGRNRAPSSSSVSGTPINVAGIRVGRISRTRALLEVENDQALIRRRLVSADSFACLLRLTRAALRECHVAGDFKNAQMLFKVTGMYVINNNNSSNYNNNNIASNVSLLDMMLQPADTTKRLGVADSTSSIPISPPRKNSSEEEVARYVLIKAAHDALEGGEIEVWQSKLFWEYVFVKALEDDFDTVLRATDGKTRRIRSHSNSKNKGSWSLTTTNEMEVGQIGSERRRRTRSLRRDSPVIFSFENVEGTALSSSRQNVRRKSSGSRGSLVSVGSVGSVGSGGSGNRSPESVGGGSDSEMIPVSLGWTEHSQRRASPPTLPALSTTGSAGSTSAPSTPVAASVGSTTPEPRKIATETVLESQIDTVSEEEEKKTKCTYIKGVDDSILREAIYDEMMDLVSIMLRVVGVGADRAHAFVHFVFAAYGMVTEESVPSKWLTTLDILIENISKALCVERQFLEGGMDALMAMAEEEEEKKEDISSLVAAASPVRHVRRKSLLRLEKDSAKPQALNVTQETGKQIGQPQSRPSFYHLDRIIGRTLATDDVSNDRATTFLNCATIKSHAGAVMCMSLNRDMLISGGADHTVNVWDTTSLRKVCVLDCGRISTTDPGVDVVSCCALGSNGTIVAGSYDKSLRVWRLPIHEVPLNWKSHMISSQVLSGHTGSILCVTLRDAYNNPNPSNHDNNKHALSKSAESTANSNISSSNDATDVTHFCLSGSYDCTIKMWNTTTGQCVATTSKKDGHSGPVLAVDSPVKSGQLCLSASQDSTASLWDLRCNFRRIRSFGMDDAANADAVLSGGSGTVGHVGPVTCCQLCSFSYGSHLCVTGGEDGLIKIWDGRTSNGLAMNLTGHDGQVNCIQAGSYVLPTLCSGGNDGTVRVWDMRKVEGNAASGRSGGNKSSSDGNALLVMHSHKKKPVRCLKFDWNKIVSSGDSNKVIVHSIHDGRVLFTGSGHGATVTGVCMDESHFISCSLDSEIRAWFAPVQ